MALQIRDVPDDVRRALAERASARGQSLQAFLLSLVEDEARRSVNLALLGRFATRDDGSRLSAGEATDVLDTERTGREQSARDRPRSTNEKA
ncbi:MAG: FitA-like ribbon-helix-helix domain-containing protein [Nocardioides sp.]